MLRKYFEDKKVIKECPSNEEKATAHKCALAWSNTCTYCEVRYDDLAKKVSASEKLSTETQRELRSSIESIKHKIEGFKFKENQI